MYRSTVKGCLGAAVTLALLLGAGATANLQAQILEPITVERPPEDFIPPPVEYTEEDGFFDRFEKFMWREVEKAVGMDLYGVTAQLPKGYLSLKWQWDMIKAGSRYNDKRGLGSVFPPIEFGEPPAISIDMGLSGNGGAHTFQISYGITDAIDWYIEFGFNYMDLKFNPTANPIDDEGNRVDPTLAGLLGIDDPKSYSGAEFFTKTLPKLGRLTPGVSYKAKWAPMDVNTGFSWNIFRSKYFSGALTARVFLPTGRIPDPNTSLMYGTGPELDVGIGGWAIGATQGYDLRVFQYSYWFSTTLSTELTVSYAFEQQRPYPTNWPTPDPAAAALDPEGNYFPDLSHITGGTFSYTPGWGVDWIAKIGMQFLIFGFEFGYGVTHSQEPELKGDEAFIRMARGLELLGQQTTWAIQVGGSVSLLPIYLPLDIAFSYRKVVDGYNAVVFDDYWQVIVKAYIPLFPE